MLKKRLAMAVLLIGGAVGSLSANNVSEDAQSLSEKDRENAIELAEELGIDITAEQDGLRGIFKDLIGDDPVEEWQKAVGEYNDKLMEIASNPRHNPEARCYALEYLALDQIETDSPEAEEQITIAKGNAMHILNDNHRVATAAHIYQANTGNLSVEQLDNIERTIWRNNVQHNATDKAENLLGSVNFYQTDDVTDYNDKLAETVETVVEGKYEARGDARSAIVDVLKSGEEIDGDFFGSEVGKGLMEKVEEAVNKAVLFDKAVDITNKTEGWGPNQ